MSAIVAGMMALTAVAVFTLTLLCFSLRDFSRSRLEEICRQHNKLDRFGEILLSYQKSLLIAELLLLILLVVAVWSAARSGQFPSLDPVSGSTPHTHPTMYAHTHTQMRTEPS